MALNVLVLGSGGREHALVWALAKSPTVGTIYAAPGNGGTSLVSDLVENVSDLSLDPAEFYKLREFAVDKKVSLVIPGPEQLLVDGIADVFRRVGIPVFGPSKDAAVFEGSKVFSKQFMSRHQVPTARYETFVDYNKAREYLSNIDYNVVLKADGIAAGKGVLIPSSQEDAQRALKTIMVEKQFGDAGNKVVIEEFLEGDEISILTISDGYSYYNLPAAQDHKRIGEGDTGLNTGGMGAYAPAPVATQKLLREIDSAIIKPTIDGMRKERLPFVGILFTGIIITSTGPKVLEYNVRFGDPETQTVLPLLSEDTDFAQVLLAAAEHRLDSVPINIKPNTFSSTVTLAAGGYPEKYNKGDDVSIDTAHLPDNSYVFHAGTQQLGHSRIVTAGGRVLSITAVDSTLKKAVEKAYCAVKCVSFPSMYFRRDIAHRALNASQASNGLTYSDAGVSVDNGNRFVENIKSKVRSTRRPGADSDIGGFGGVFDLKQAGYDSKDTLLVAATDGVGTKLMIAQETGIHGTVGIDLVAMNVNDLVVQGAEPLLFLDYYATGSLDIAVAAEFVSGVADGCIQSGCALVGGETSEMPGMYPEGHYDTNGTAVGAVLRSSILPKIESMDKGDVLLGLASNGIHSNGFSLVRKIIGHSGLGWDASCPWNTNRTLGEAVLDPTKIYVQQLLPAMKKGLLLGLAHITGGGLVENIPRALPKTLQAKVDITKWSIPKVFYWLQSTGNVPWDDMLRTFNMGIGMVLIVKHEDVETVKKLLDDANETVFEIGYLVERPAGVSGCVVEGLESII